MKRLLFPIVMLLALLGVTAPVAAGGSVSFGVSIGSGYGHHHGYRHHGHRHHAYRHHGYHHRYRHYYGPPAVVYVPPPRTVYVQPAPPPAPVVCQDYRGDATIDGSGGRPFYGRACLLGDGRWHIVRVD